MKPVLAAAAALAFVLSAALQPIATGASALLGLALLPTLGWRRTALLLAVLLIAAHLGVRVDAAPPSASAVLDVR